MLALNSRLNFQSPGPLWGERGHAAEIATVNVIVVTASMVIMLLVYWHDIVATSKRTTLDPKQAYSDKQLPVTRTYLDYPSLRTAFWYFFGSLSCVLISHLLTVFDKIGVNRSEEAKWAKHVIVDGSETVIGNVANASLLIAAMAYGLGEKLKTGLAKKVRADLSRAKQASDGCERIYCGDEVALEAQPSDRQWMRRWGSVGDDNSRAHYLLQEAEPWTRTHLKRD
jgi:hypothetical protein